MSKATRATQMLAKAGIAFSLHPYAYDADADHIGMQAAAALGEDPARVLKTLMTLVDGKPACVVLPAGHEVSMKKLAAALHGKRAEMMRPADAERATGYKVGGISPFGQMRRAPAVLEATATPFPTVFINAGQRGLLMEIAPTDAIRALDAVVADIIS